MHRVQRRHRLLEDHRDAAAAHGAHCLAENCARSWPESKMRPLSSRPRAGQEAHDGERGDGLAAARLADEPESLARRDGEANAVDDSLVAAFRVEPAA